MICTTDSEPSQIYPVYLIRGVHFDKKMDCESEIFFRVKMRIRFAFAIFAIKRKKAKFVIEDLSLAAFADAIAVAVQIVERILGAAFQIAAESLAAFQGFVINFRSFILEKIPII